MAPAKEEERVRLRNVAMREVILYTNANRGQWTTKAQQESALQALIDQRRLQHIPTGANANKQRHTVASLRGLIQRTVRARQAKRAVGDKGNSYDDFFVLGSNVFAEDFLAEIDFNEQEQEEGLTYGGSLSEDQSKNAGAGAGRQERGGSSTARQGNARTEAAGAIMPDTAPAAGSLNVKPRLKLNAGKKRSAPDAELDDQIEISDSASEHASQVDRGRQTKKLKMDQHGDRAGAEVQQEPAIGDNAAESLKSPAQTGKKRSADVLEAESAESTATGGADGPQRKKSKPNDQPSEGVSDTDSAQPPVSALLRDRPLPATQKADQAHAEVLSDSARKEAANPKPQHSAISAETLKQPAPSISIAQPPHAVEEQAEALGIRSDGAAAAPSRPEQSQRPSSRQEPPIAPVSRPRSRTDLDTRLSDNRVAEAMDSARHHIKSAVSIFCMDRGIVLRDPVNFLTHPEEGLERLYEIFLGTDKWRERILALEFRENAYTITADRALEGLIAASIHKEVFQTPLPWNIEDRFNDTFSDVRAEFQRASSDRGYVFENTLKHVMWLQAWNPEYQETVMRRYAKKLAEALAMDLAPHLKKLTRKPGHKIRYDDTWIEEIEHAFHDAIVLKTKLDAAHDATFEYVWFAGDDPFVKRNMESCYETEDPGDLVVTLVPGIRITTARRTAFASRALVLAMPPERMGKGKGRQEDIDARNGSGAATEGGRASVATQAAEGSA
ncbi:hypothetical protein LTR85_006787 [Meristemomyces frigidus]|nr:hypothetical protein LTR85_006787 [Meristemomyces frigidus]